MMSPPAPAPGIRAMAHRNSVRAQALPTVNASMGFDFLSKQGLIAAGGDRVLLAQLGQATATGTADWTLSPDSHVQVRCDSAAPPCPAVASSRHACHPDRAATIPTPHSVPRRSPAQPGPSLRLRPSCCRGISRPPTSSWSSSNTKGPLTCSLGAATPLCTSTSTAPFPPSPLPTPGRSPGRSGRTRASRSRW